MKDILGFGVVFLLIFVVLKWQRRMKRLQSIETLRDSELKRAFAYTMRWSLAAGISWGLVFWFWATGVASLAFIGLSPRMPSWMPAPTLFVPVMLGIMCATLASHPPLKKWANDSRGNETPSGGN
jgi:hypothetical protein